jgi:hypothetical protein
MGLASNTSSRVALNATPAVVADRIMMIAVLVQKKSFEVKHGRTDQTIQHNSIGTNISRADHAVHRSPQ